MLHLHLFNLTTLVKRKLWLDGNLYGLEESTSLSSLNWSYQVFSSQNSPHKESVNYFPHSKTKHKIIQFEGRNYSVVAIRVIKYIFMNGLWTYKITNFGLKENKLDVSNFLLVLIVLFYKQSKWYSWNYRQVLFPDFSSLPHSSSLYILDQNVDS